MTDSTIVAATVAGSGGNQGSANILSLSENQVADIGAGDSVKFDTVSGDLIVTLDQFTVPANQEATFDADLFATFSSSTAIVSYRWYDVTNAALIGIEGADNATSRAVNASAKTTARARVKPLVDTVYELRIVSPTALTNFDASRSKATVLFIGDVVGNTPVIWVDFAANGNWTNTTYTGRYLWSGDNILVVIHGICTGTPASGSLVLDMVPGFTVVNGPSVGDVMPSGIGRILDAGTISLEGSCRWIESSEKIEVECLRDDQGGGGAYVQNLAITPIVPFTWTTNDEFWIQIDLRVEEVSS